MKSLNWMIRWSVASQLIYKDRKKLNKAKDAHYFSFKTSMTSQCFMFHFVFCNDRQVLQVLVQLISFKI